MVTQSAVVLRETSVMGSLATCLFWVFPFLSKGKFYILPLPLAVDLLCCFTDFIECL